MKLRRFVTTRLVVSLGLALGISNVVENVPAQPAAAAQAQHKSVPSELVLQFKAGATDQEIADALTQGGLEIKKHIQTPAMKDKGHHGITHVVTHMPVEQALRKLNGHAAVEYAEPNWIYTHQSTANDAYFTGGYMWGAYGDLSSPASVYGSQAAEAWSAGYTGSSSVYVGVVDEGIQFTHPDLAENIWNNPNEAVDGADNDGNGYADDIHGWNFVSNNNLIYEGTSDDHGTHVAGTIGARGGNGTGVAGISWNVTIISGKFLGASGGTLADAVEAIDYFTALKTRKGLNIVALNNSWGGGGYSQALHDAILRAAKAGILFVAAAGNGDANGNGLNNDTTPNYPSNYDTRQGTSTEGAANYNAVIAVAAIDSNGNKASFSNYGGTKVHLGAPGVGIYSTLPTDTYGGYSGTSMATPHVTGAVALYASTHPGATANEIRSAILNSVTPTPSLTGITTTGGRLNLSSIVGPIATAPVPPSGLTATASGNQIALKWNPSTGASSYTVKRATTSGGPYTSIASGVTATSYTDTSSLSPGTTYYYVLAAVSSAGTSADSSEASASIQIVAVPAAPTGITATAGQAKVTGSSAVVIKWNASTGATSYKVKRGTSPAGPFTVITSSASGLSFTDTVTANGTSYYYVVSAVNASGESTNSISLAVTPAAPTPKALTATAASRSQINLAWTDQSSDETGFKVEISTNGGISYYQLGSVASTATTVGVTGLAANTTYYFRLRAYNVSGNTAYSNTAAGRTMP